MKHSIASAAPATGTVTISPLHQRAVPRRTGGIFVGAKATTSADLAPTAITARVCCLIGIHPTNAGPPVVTRCPSE
jgi:hypothetical protein